MLRLCLVWERSFIRHSLLRAMTLSGKKKLSCKYVVRTFSLIFFVGAGGWQENKINCQGGGRILLFVNAISPISTSWCSATCMRVHRLHV